MPRINPFQVLQIFLFFVLLLFGFALLTKWITVPDGPSGEWFKQVWTVFLLVLSPQALAAMISRSDGAEPTKVVSAEPDTPTRIPEAGFIKMRTALLLCLFCAVLLLMGCATANVNPIVSCGDNNKQAIKATDSDTPSTSVSTQATIPLK